jgi:large subunit ribosomal protein L15
MNIHAPAGSRRRRRFVGRGRGTGKGCTAGRGSNGQKSRSGYSRKIGFEGGQMPLARRLPKRGFNNTRYGKVFQTVSTGDLNGFEAGTIVDYEALLSRRLVDGKTAFVKLLAGGELTKKLTVKVHRASRKAREEVKRAGGALELLQPDAPPARKAKKPETERKTGTAGQTGKKEASGGTEDAASREAPKVSSGGKSGAPAKADKKVSAKGGPGTKGKTDSRNDAKAAPGTAPGEGAKAAGDDSKSDPKKKE